MTIKVRARSRSGSVHVTIGRVTGGVPNKAPGIGTPYTSKQDAIEHLTGPLIGWQILEFIEE